MTRYPRKSIRFFKFLKFQKIKNVMVECDYCNYAGFGNDYRYIGTVDDWFEHFWSFWVRCGASMSKDLYPNGLELRNTIRSVGIAYRFPRSPTWRSSVKDSWFIVEWESLRLRLNQLTHVNWLRHPESPNTELTVFEGPVPSTLTRTTNPEKVFLNTFLPY